MTLLRERARRDESPSARHRGPGAHGHDALPCILLLPSGHCHPL